MASSSGTSSGGSGSSTLLQNSSSEEDLQLLMDQRKRKRMISNRESARRSRMRKQKHLDDLVAQVTQLTKENNHIVTNLNITTQAYLNIESENSVLRAQMGELSHRLDSLNEMISYLNANTVFESEEVPNEMMNGNDNAFMNPWNLVYLNQQPIMASPDMFQY